MKKTCYIRTFGCQMNEHDSGKMRLLLAKEGYSFVDDPGLADLILFNTCTIREKAYHKAESEIGYSLIFKNKKPDIIIGVCGCVASQDGESLKGRFSHIDIVFGPDQIASLPDMLRSLEKGSSIVSTELINSAEKYNFVESTPAKVAGGHAFVTVVKGCNCACTYCIVPSVRGREVSRKVEDIVTEIKSLVTAGVKEVTLLGQNVTAYKSGQTSLAELIKKISGETDIKRIRFMSPHPKDVDDALINEFSSNSKLCPHIHLPAQSGSNEMLKKMGRGYTKERYLELVDKLKNTRDRISITSDFIVGFCDETDKNFEDTMDLLNRVEFDSIFAFKYSPRPGTPAASHLKDNVPEAVKDARLELVLSTQRAITKRKNEELVGLIEPMLVTGADRKKTGRLMGRLEDNRIVNFAGNSDLIGIIIPVRIKRALANSLEGEYV